MLGMVACPATDDISTMRPKPRRTMPGSAARAQLKAPLTCTFCSACHSAGVISTTGLRFWLPALLTSTSGAHPAASSSRSARDGLAVGHVERRARRMPAAFKRSQAASQACADRSLTTTFAPARPSARAMAYPVPARARHQRHASPARRPGPDNHSSSHVSLYGAHPEALRASRRGRGSGPARPAPRCPDGAAPHTRRRCPEDEHCSPDLYSCRVRSCLPSVLRQIGVDINLNIRDYF